MTTSQFQPYLAGWEMRPPRLVPKTTETTTAVTAATDPSRVDRTGTVRWPDPGSSALRVPMIADAGSPAAAAAVAMAAGRVAGPPPRWLRWRSGNANRRWTC